MSKYYKNDYYKSREKMSKFVLQNVQYIISKPGTISPKNLNLPFQDVPMGH